MSENTPTAQTELVKLSKEATEQPSQPERHGKKPPEFSWQCNGFRKCPHCKSDEQIIRFGTIGKRQRYYCKSCKKAFMNKPRQKKLKDKIFKEYVYDSLNSRYLARKYHRHVNTIHKIIGNYPVNTKVDLESLTPRQKNRIKCVIMDTTYYGESCGYVAAIDASTGMLLYFKHISRPELSMDYRQAIDEIVKAGIPVEACVIDGREGVRDMLLERGIAVQYCLFHVAVFAKRALGKKRSVEAIEDLKTIVRRLTCTKYSLTKSEFEDAMRCWRIRYRHWFKQKYYDPIAGKNTFMHANARKIYFWLLRNARFFFTSQDAEGFITIPRTSSRIEGKFGNIKDKMRIHKGCSEAVKTKLVFLLLKGRPEDY